VNKVGNIWIVTGVGLASGAGCLSLRNILVVRVDHEPASCQHSKLTKWRFTSNLDLMVS